MMSADAVRVTTTDPGQARSTVRPESMRRSAPLTEVPPSLSILAEEGSEVGATPPIRRLRLTCRTTERAGVVRLETRTRGKGRVCSAARQPCPGAPFNDVPRYQRPRAP